MEEKKEIKVRLSTVVYLFIILILVVALGVVYYLGFVKNDNANNMIANGEVTEKNNISVNEQMPETSNNNTINITENISSNNSSDNEYTEITKELNSKDVLYVTKAEKNSDNTYTLYGVVFKCNENVNPDYQISDTWTITNDYKKITVSSDTTCIAGYPKDEETTVGEYFNNYGEVELQKVVENTPLTDKYTYSFKFENGKCVEVIDYCTSV